MGNRKLKGQEFPPFETTRLDGRPVTINVRRLFVINEADIPQELIDAPGVYAWLMQLKEDAHEGMKQAKYKAHKRYERKYAAIREKSARLSETAAKLLVHRDERWLAFIETYMDWRRKYRVLEDLCRAWKERNDNLRTLEASNRKERDL